MTKSTGQALPLVAIVGRPNVGKSTLFNRLIGQRRAIVGDEPGITRDRIYGEADWRTRRFALVDTGGIVPDDDAVIPANILKQAGFAINEAEALVWVVDARKGITPLDQELAQDPDLAPLEISAAQYTTISVLAKCGVDSAAQVFKLSQLDPSAIDPRVGKVDEQKLRASGVEPGLKV